MDLLRYAIAVMLIMAIPAGIAFWLLIHPLVKLWRRWGAGIAYLVVCSLVLLLMSVMYFQRSRLLAADFGLSWPLAVSGAVLLFCSGIMLVKVRRHLTVRALVGLPELSPPPGGGELLTSGIYGVIRHPRYLQMDLAILGYALIANYPAVYLMALLWVIGIHGVVLLEEKELLDRFGKDYRDYCARTPRYFPRWNGRK